MKTKKTEAAKAGPEHDSSRDFVRRCNVFFCLCAALIKGEHDYRVRASIADWFLLNELAPRIKKNVEGWENQDSGKIAIEIIAACSDDFEYGNKLNISTAAAILLSTGDLLQQAFIADKEDAVKSLSKALCHTGDLFRQALYQTYKVDGKRTVLIFHKRKPGATTAGLE